MSEYIKYKLEMIKMDRKKITEDLIILKKIRIKKQKEAGIYSGFLEEALNLFIKA